MMFNPHPSNGHGEGRDREVRRVPGHVRGDREVEIGGPSLEIAAAVHAWLDGTVPERDARRASSSHSVDFWKTLDDDLARRRRLRTPAGLNARIMNAIPQHVPMVISPWWRREFVVTPSIAILTLALAVALSATVTALILR